MNYRKLFELLERRGMKRSDLVFEGVISKGTLGRLVHDRPVSLRTLERLCRYLECGIRDIAE